MIGNPDWSAPAKLMERDDAGSERDIYFHDSESGTLAALVAKVAAMTTAERARVVIDAGRQGTVDVAQILALAGREDFPRG